MSERYFVDSPIVAQRVSLRGSEAHHLARVMRAQPGDRVVLFDGSGSEFIAEVARVARSHIDLEVITSRVVNRELPNELTFGVAFPRGDRQRWLVEKAVELGVAQLVPLITARSVVVPGASVSVRLARTVIEASKQCGRNRLLRISQPQSLANYLAAASAAASRLVAHPLPPGEPPPLRGTAASQSGGDRSWKGRDERPVFVAVGPEGGFTDAELASARELGWQQVDLGPRVLRVETAAVALAAHITLGGWGGRS